MALLSIGMFVFAVPTVAYDHFQRRSDWRHARQARVGAREATQFIGPGEDTITISGSVASEITDGSVSIDQLRDLADQGEAQQLVAGDGRVIGSFIITGVDVRSSSFWPDGSPRVIEFSVDLLRVDPPAWSVA